MAPTTGNGMTANLYLCLSHACFPIQELNSLDFTCASLLLGNSLREGGREGGRKGKGGGEGGREDLERGKLVLN